MKYFFILTSILSVAFSQPQEIHFGQGVKVTIFENDSVAIGESPIRSEEACGSFVYPNGKKLISNGQTTWNEKGDTVFINKNANESTSQGVVFVPVKNVVTGQLLYVEQICLINLGRKEGANVTRYDSEGNLSKDSIKSLKFTGEHLLEEKMGVMVFEDAEKSPYTMYRLFFKEVGTNRVITFDINKYEKSPDVKIKYHYFKDSSSIGNYNTTGCMNVNRFHISYVNPADKRVSYATYNPILNVISRPSSTIIEDANNLYGLGYHYSNILIALYNRIDALSYGNNRYSLYSDYHKDFKTAKDTTLRFINIYSFDIDKFGNTNVIIAVPNSNKLIYWGNKRKEIITLKNNEPNNPKVRYGLPIPLVYYNSYCREVDKFRLLGSARIGNKNEIELTSTKLFSCGMLQFEEKVENKAFNVSADFGVIDGTNNSLDDGSEEGADGFSIVFSNEKISDCNSVAGQLGYSGLKNAFAFEIDLYKNLDYNDPNGNHFAIILPESTTGVLSPIHPLDIEYRRKTIFTTSLKDTNYYGVFQFYYDSESISIFFDTDNDIQYNVFYTLNKRDSIYNIINDIIKKGVYVSIFGTTGNAVQKHCIISPSLCINMDSNISSINTQNINSLLSQKKISILEAEKILSNGGRFFDITGKIMTNITIGIYFLELDNTINKVIIIE